MRSRACHFALSIAFLAMIFSAMQAVAQTHLNAQQEEQAKALFYQLRCVVCQNQSIGDSDADVAKDLREIVREQVAAGKSDSQIKSYLVARYGEFILLQPVFAWHTLILWAAPIALLLLGGLFAHLAFRGRRRTRSDDELTAEEEAQLAEILSKKTD